MSALAEALVAAQRRAIAQLEKAYVAQAFEDDRMREMLDAMGCADAVDQDYLIQALDVIRAYGGPLHARKKASPGQWQRIIAEKQGQCLVCERLGARAITPYIDYHHLVPRARGGDDTADNIVPLCSLHHQDVTANNPHALAALQLMLTTAERAYCESKMGAEWSVRLFGVGGTER